MPIRFAHTNLIAHDWRALAEFYTRLFECKIVPPERDFSGSDLERATGLPGAHLRGAHLRLPGYGERGPTLEIFNYADLAEGLPPAPNRPGFGHIAFEVDDVITMHERVISDGGQAIGEVITLTVATGARVTWCYVTDPEGNIIELQAWD